MKYNNITPERIKYNLIHLSQIVFEVTDACNLRCKYCAYSELYEGYDSRENLKFPFIRAKKIIDFMYDLWKNNYIEGITEPVTISFYGGEPLLNITFIKGIIHYIENLPFVGKIFYYSMTTNAMLLHKYMEYLTKKEFRLLISLDGDEYGQSYRIDANGNNSFTTVFNNVELLKNNYPDYFEKYVMFNTVLHNRNDVENSFSFIKKAFDKETHISPLNTSGIRPDRVEEFKRTYRNYYESINQASNCESLKTELFIKAPETNLVLKFLYYQSGNVFFNNNTLLLSPRNAKQLPTGTCTPFSKKMFVIPQQVHS